MTATYTTTSPWYTTKIQNNWYLDHLKIRPVAASVDDFLYKIESQYTYRPDLLAYDLYKIPQLWWVFMQRNLDVIQDPIFDFVPGVQIYVPKLSGLKTSLGI